MGDLGATIPDPNRQRKVALASEPLLLVDDAFTNYREMKLNLVRTQRVPEPRTRIALPGDQKDPGDVNIQIGHRFSRGVTEALKLPATGLNSTPDGADDAKISRRGARLNGHSGWLPHGKPPVCTVQNRQPCRTFGQDA